MGNTWIMCWLKSSCKRAAVEVPAKRSRCTEVSEEDDRTLGSSGFFLLIRDVQFRILSAPLLHQEGFDAFPQRLAFSMLS